jgi:hypothetical protein
MGGRGGMRTYERSDEREKRKCALSGRYLAHAAFTQVGRDGLKHRGWQCEVEDAVCALEECAWSKGGWVGMGWSGVAKSVREGGGSRLQGSCRRTDVLRFSMRLSSSSLRLLNPDCGATR